MHDLADLGDRLDRADLVVGGHDRDQDRLVGDRRPDLVGVDPAVLVDRQVRDRREPFALQRACRCRARPCARSPGVMMWLPFSLYISATPLIARLLLSVAPLVKMISLALAPISAATCSRAVVDRLLGLPAEGVVAAGGVAERLGEVRQHRLDHPRIDRRRGVVVHVDAASPSALPALYLCILELRRFDIRPAIRALSGQRTFRDSRTCSVRDWRRLRACARTLRRKLAGVDASAARDLLGRARRDDRPPAVAALGPEVDHAVGALHDVEVVLDQEHRVARVDQPAEDVEQPPDVLEVQAGGRLVEDVERAARGPARQLAARASRAAPRRPRASSPAARGGRSRGRPRAASSSRLPDRRDGRRGRRAPRRRSGRGRRRCCGPCSVTSSVSRS